MLVPSPDLNDLSVVLSTSTHLLLPDGGRAGLRDRAEEAGERQQDKYPQVRMSSRQLSCIG